MSDPTQATPNEPQLSDHDKAMIAKVDATQAALPGTKEPAAAAASASSTPATRPEHIPEKFWDAEKGVAKVEEMARSYAELEKTRSQAPASGAKTPEQAAAEAAAAAGDAGKGIDFATYTNEFATSGKLSEDSYKALEAKGIPKAVVDDYIASKAAVAKVEEFESQAAISEAHSLAGSKETYSEMLTWAATGLSAAEQAAFDKAVTGDAASRKQAIVALKAQYVAARGSDPKLIAGEGQGGGEGAFESRAQVTAAMRDPRYKSDPAYRAQVERRIGAMPTF